NVSFGLRMHKTPENEITQRVAEPPKMVQLEDFAGRKPGHLSGGQLQRVAIALARVNRPEVLLLDLSLPPLVFIFRQLTTMELKARTLQLGLQDVLFLHDL
ncbi:ATP-binding cassette domain-containing protein, partial [Morganella morganii]|uniref:ATP-binding cassette domain-containing protein n=1 Tax=Morganella morganii TaxID=582 RepID=UPI0015F64461